MPWALRKRLREARPNIVEIFPVIHYLVIGFGIFNTVLGVTMLIWGNRDLSIITPYTPSWAWAVVFLIIGIAMLTALFINSWKGVRTLLLVGILVKTIWGYALIFSPDGVSVIVPMWLFIAYIQIMTYVLFTPTPRLKDAK